MLNSNFFSLQGKRVLITGVGVKALNFIFKDMTTGEPTHIPIHYENQIYKANVSTAVALECARLGAKIHIMAPSKTSLTIVSHWIKEQLPEADVNTLLVDMNDVEAAANIIQHIPNDLPLYWVQSAGLGAGTVKLANDNPYLPVDQLSSDVVKAELSAVLNTIDLLKMLSPRFRQQAETRICIISSMSAIRSYQYGSVHCAAKGAISRFTNAAMLELAKEKIYITDIRPGAMDTGFYDSEKIRHLFCEIAKSYGTDWSENAGGLKLASPLAVAKIITTILTLEAHVTSVNLVSRGQHPHEGS